MKFSKKQVLTATIIALLSANHCFASTDAISLAGHSTMETSPHAGYGWAGGNINLNGVYSYTDSQDQGFLVTKTYTQAGSNLLLQTRTFSWGTKYCDLVLNTGTTTVTLATAYGAIEDVINGSISWNPTGAITPSSYSFAGGTASYAPPPITNNFGSQATELSKNLSFEGGVWTPLIP